MSSQITESKRRLRRQMSLLRNGVSAADSARAGELAAKALIELDLAKRAERIALYAALPYELPTRPLFDAVVEQNGVALLPRTTDPIGLEFFAVERWDALRPGAFGVPEPQPDGSAVRLRPADLVVVPGVAFDPAGYRLGHGKGYYDRAFAAELGDSPTLVGFGYEFQIVDAVPHDQRDRQMDAIVTDQKVRDCSGCLQ
ncbi:MAG: 5-formyltetrahydrofolate cyclo-ligase [Deltaproteobacteria bacterium]|jgi:5-formyltetrahydrofolate cyclo-ligase|nr:5-formyltetrahydrofolate cyclo-ligase [Deltaproteobacteria bacterium]MBW2543719.1 5-formyltetrahydrofolate cyclo-ligase [Deltaproteobacteria bacterium]